MPGGVDGIDVLLPDLTSFRDIPSSGCELIMGGKFDTSSFDLEHIENLASILRGSGSKAILDMRDMQGRMYDLAADPSEQLPLEPDSGLVEALGYYWATPPTGSPAAVRDVLADERLRDLGYL